MYLPATLLACLCTGRRASSLFYIYVDVEAKRAYACNGMLAVSIHIVPTDEEVSGLLSPEALKYAHARQAENKGFLFHYSKYTRIGDIDFPNPVPPKAYPITDIRALFAEPGKRHGIRLDADLLYDTARALYHHPKELFVTVSWNTLPGMFHVSTGDDAFAEAVLMSTRHQTQQQDTAWGHEETLEEQP